MHHRPAVLWFTGLSGAGKSTIANLVEAGLHARGVHTLMLDGDNVRHGLNKDLGFTEADRVENIRRIGEVAKLMTEAGLVVLCSFISPFRAERRMVRELVADGEFIEVFVDTPIEQCIARDPKGLYRRALAGEIKNFTGVDQAYEAPEHAELHLMAGDSSAAAFWPSRWSRNWRGGRSFKSRGSAAFSFVCQLPAIDGVRRAHPATALGPRAAMTPPLLFDLRGKRVFVAGHKGMAGSGDRAAARGEGCEILTADRAAARSAPAGADRALARAAQAGRGVHRRRPGRRHLRQRRLPADFIVDNLAIGLNVIRGAFKAGVKKLLALGSSCIYPRLAPQPMRGRGAAHRPAGADQRMVRGRQDRGDQAVRSLPQAARRRFHLGDADQSLRPRRQLSSRPQPRAGGADPPLP